MVQPARVDKGFSLLELTNKVLPQGQLVGGERGCCRGAGPARGVWRGGVGGRMTPSAAQAAATAACVRLLWHSLR